MNATSLAPRPVTLDDFLARVSTVNPFLDNRVNGPLRDDGDARDVHRAAFERLTALALESCQSRRGLGAVLWGEAGVGKSHILARLGRWATEQNRARYIYLHNLQASPDQLPRSILRGVLSILTLGRASHFRGTPLFQMVANFAHEASGYARERTTMEAARWHYDRLVDRLGLNDPAQAALVDRNVYHVLFEFFRSACEEAKGQADGLAGAAVRWLAGDALDPQEAQRLGLIGGPSRHDPVCLRDNQQVKQVLIALTRLAQSRQQPFVLCFDQVDNLDVDQMGSLARFLEALLDSSPNLFVVTAGVRATLLGWREKKVIQDSAWDRIAQFEVTLHRVGSTEAERIVAARLTSFLEPYQVLAEVGGRQHEDALFPLGRLWRKDTLEGRADLRPRDVLSKAREGWNREQEVLRERGGVTWLRHWGESQPTRTGVVAPPTEEEFRQAIDREVQARIDEHRDQRIRQPHTLPWDSDHLTGLVTVLLEGWRKATPTCPVRSVTRVQAPRKGARPPLDLLVRYSGPSGQEKVTSVLFLATSTPIATTASLRNAVTCRQKADRFVLVTDGRQSLELGAKGQEYMDQLTAGAAGAYRHVALPFEDYAALDSLQLVVGLSRSQDLEVEFSGEESRRITEAEVLASHDRCGRYGKAPLLRELLD